MKNMMRNKVMGILKVSFISVLVVLAGCASNKAIITPKQQQGFQKAPEQNKRAKVSVGDVLYEESDYVEQSIAKVILPIQVRVMLTGSAVDGKFVLSDVGARQLYCGTVIFNGSQTQSVCMIDTANSGLFDKILWVNTLGDGEETLRQPVQYFADKEKLSGYRQELTYQGRKGNSVTLQYREYSGNLARPAYSQSVSYDLDSASETHASFRGLAITIYSADNSGIDFSVNGQIRRSR